MAESEPISLQGKQPPNTEENETATKRDPARCHTLKCPNLSIYHVKQQILVRRISNNFKSNKMYVLLSWDRDVVIITPEKDSAACYLCKKKKKKEKTLLLSCQKLLIAFNQPIYYLENDCIKIHFEDS